MDSNLENPYFINNFKKKNISEKYFTNNTNDVKIEKSKIIEKCFDTNKTRTEDYNSIKTIFSSYISILDYSIFYKFYRYDYYFLKKLSYYNVDNLCLFYNEKYKL